MSIFNIIIGTAGHIDHGKSSVVKNLTGIHPDRLKEEKERGLTIDLGFAPLTLPTGEKVGIIDVPGHEKFVKNMVAGATGIDYVILVIAADDGVMPQTREHLEIMQLLGIKRGMIVISKIDIVEKEFLLLVEEDIHEFISGTFLEGCKICEVSTITKEGWESFVATLFSEIETLKPRSHDGIFRMPIQRVFSRHGHGTVVTGIPISGQVTAGQQIEILPQGITSTIKKMHAYGEEILEAKAGHSTALNLRDVHYDKICRGNIVTIPGYLKTTSFVEGKFLYLKENKRNLEHLTPIRFHSGTVEIMGKIVALQQEVLAPGDEGFVQIRLEEPVVVAPGDHFIIRLSSPMITIGGGVVIDSGHRKLKRFRTGTIDKLEIKSRSIGNDKQFVESCIRDALFFKESELEKKCLLDKQTFNSIIQELLDNKIIEVLMQNSKRYIHRETIQEQSDKIAQIIKNYFNTNNYKLYMPIIELKNLSHLETQELDFLLKSMLRNKVICIKNDKITFANKNISLRPKEVECKKAIENEFLTREFSPPNREEALKNINLKNKEQIFDLLLEEEILIEIGRNFIFHSNAIEEARNIIITTIKEKGHLVSSDFRDMVKTSRKYAIPLLDYFDKIELTVREDNSRFLKE